MNARQIIAGVEKLEARLERVDPTYRDPQEAILRLATLAELERIIELYGEDDDAPLPEANRRELEAMMDTLQERYNRGENAPDEP